MNNPVETDHGHLKSRLRPVRGLNGAMGMGVPAAT